MTARGGRSTSMPARASSCRRFPSILTAETIGGICSMAPTKPAAAALDIGERDAGHVPLPHHVTRGVECRRRRAEHHLARIGLGQVGEEAQQSGHAAQPDQQHPGGVGIERARVADPLLPEDACGTGPRRRATSIPPACRRRPARRSACSAARDRLHRSAGLHRGQHLGRPSARSVKPAAKRWPPPPKWAARRPTSTSETDRSDTRTPSGVSFSTHDTSASAARRTRSIRPSVSSMVTS